jgi:VIT1/CCC1 family predicted Fe2+/Mn2+ transporter
MVSLIAFGSGPIERPMIRRHAEHHRTDRIGWLRAAVLGVNDGIVSTASLLIGVATAHQNHSSILLTGIAGLVAGAMSMAAGEYVSVHSQADTEAADLARERSEIEIDPVAEQRELTAIYVGRGLSYSLAQQVAGELMEHDALAAHARDAWAINGEQAANARVSARRHDRDAARHSNGAVVSRSARDWPRP